MVTLSTDVQRWPIAGTFTISRGSRTEAVVVVVTLAMVLPLAMRMRAYARYHESIELGVIAALEAFGHRSRRA